MKLTDEQVRGLLEVVRLTRDQELTCDECLAELANFAETSVAERTANEAYRLVREHLAVCSECREEFELLLVGLAEITQTDETND